MPAALGPGTNGKDGWPPIIRRLSVIASLAILAILIFEAGRAYSELVDGMDHLRERVERLEEFYYPKSPMEGP